MIQDFQSRDIPARASSCPITLLRDPAGAPIDGPGLARVFGDWLEGRAIRLCEEPDRLVMDDGLLLIVHHAPARTLAWLLGQGHTPEAAADEWTQQAGRMIALHRQARSRVIAVDVALLADPDALAAGLAARIGAPADRRPTPFVPDAIVQRPAALDLLIAHALLETHVPAETRGILAAMSCAPAHQGRDLAACCEDAWTELSRIRQGARDNLDLIGLLREQIRLHDTLETRADEQENEARTGREATLEQQLHDSATRSTALEAELAETRQQLEAAARRLAVEAELARATSAAQERRMERLRDTARLREGAAAAALLQGTARQDDLEQRIARLASRRSQLEDELSRMRNSRSWRLTRPLRRTPGPAPQPVS